MLTIVWEIYVRTEETAQWVLFCLNEATNISVWLWRDIPGQVWERWLRELKRSKRWFHSLPRGMTTKKLSWYTHAWSGYFPIKVCCTAEDSPSILLLTNSSCYSCLTTSFPQITMELAVTSINNTARLSRKWPFKLPLGWSLDISIFLFGHSQIFRVHLSGSIVTFLD